MSESEQKEISDQPGARFLRLIDVQQRVGLGRSTIYRWMDQGKFPKSHSVGGYAARWLESDIDDWMASKIS